MICILVAFFFVHLKKIQKKMPAVIGTVVPEEAAFVLMRTSDGVVVHPPTAELEASGVIDRAIHLWKEQNGLEILEGQQGIREHIAVHWISMPRSILRTLDFDHPGLGRVKFIQMHLNLYTMMLNDLNGPSVA